MQDLSWEIDDRRFTGKLIIPEKPAVSLPGLLMVPSWMGPTEQSVEKARWLAGNDYVILMADVYGEEVRPTNPGEAGQAAGALRADPVLD